MIFDRCLVRLGLVLAPFLAPKLGQNRPKIGPRRVLRPLFFKNVDFQKNERRPAWERDSGPPGAPKMPQDRAKITPRRSYFGSFFASFFASIFGRFLVRFWCHLGRFLGTQIGHVGHRFFDDFCVSFQDRSKTAQDWPKSGLAI